MGSNPTGGSIVAQCVQYPSYSVAMFKILTHSRAAKLKLTARTGQSISLRPKSGKGNSVLNSHPTPTQPHMSAFSKTPPPLRVLLLCAFPSSGRSRHCRFARALCARGAARRREDTGGAKEESFRRRKPRSAPSESAAKAGSSPQAALVLSASIWFRLSFSVFHKLGLLFFW